MCSNRKLSMSIRKPDTCRSRAKFGPLLSMDRGSRSKNQMDDCHNHNNKWNARPTCFSYSNIGSACQVHQLKCSSTFFEHLFNLTSPTKWRSIVQYYWPGSISCHVSKTARPLFGMQSGKSPKTLSSSSFVTYLPCSVLYPQVGQLNCLEQQMMHTNQKRLVPLGTSTVHTVQKGEEGCSVPVPLIRGRIKRVENCGFSNPA